jgi:hypothetical protein
MSYSTTRAFKPKILRPGQLSAALNALISRYTPSLETAEIFVVEYLPDGSRHSWDLEHFTELDPICDLKCFSMTAWFRNDATPDQGRIWIMWTGSKGCVEIDIHSEVAQEISRMFDAVIAELQLDETQTTYAWVMGMSGEGGIVDQQTPPQSAPIQITNHVYTNGGDYISTSGGDYAGQDIDKRQITGADDDDKPQR